MPMPPVWFSMRFSRLASVPGIIPITLWDVDSSCLLECCSEWCSSRYCSKKVDSIRSRSAWYASQVQHPSGTHSA